MDIQQSVARKRGRPPKRPEETLETRELLVRAGLEALTEKGFSATGIDEVLKRVGVPKGSFYHYFESKEALLNEIIYKSLSEIYKYFDINRDGVLTEEEFEFFVGKYTKV